MALYAALFYGQLYIMDLRLAAQLTESICSLEASFLILGDQAPSSCLAKLSEWQDGATYAQKNGM